MLNDPQRVLQCCSANEPFSELGGCHVCLKDTLKRYLLFHLREAFIGHVWAILGHVIRA
jgi:hypothetical protein